MQVDDTTKGTGIAIDLGTTTIVGSAIDLATGRAIGCVSLPNPQSRWGLDVLTRIEAIREDGRLVKTLSDATVGAINEIIHRLVDRVEDIREIGVAGNSVMEHILLGISPEPIARIPFRPVFRDAKRLKALSIGVDVMDRTMLYTFPLVSGFVGGDAVSVIFYLGLHRVDSPTLAIDIGTNSEIILATRGRIFATSTPAGPAFEGGNIGCGMVAGRGAISEVRIDGERVSVETIGSVLPEGICGSGIVDCVSALLASGVMDRSGRIKTRDELPDNLSNRIEESPEGNAFVLYRSARKKIVLSQKDVRALQVAKSAIRAGIKVILKKAGVEEEDIKRVFIAGAFGNNLKKDSLVNIGVLKREWLDVSIPVGDAALEGVVRVLGSEEKKREVEDIARTIRYISLSGSRPFEREFIKNMDFH